MAVATVIKNFGKVEISSNNLTEEKTMADESMAFAEYIRQQGGEDFLKGVVERVLARLMDYEVGNQIGAGHFAGGGLLGAGNGPADGDPGLAQIGKGIVFVLLRLFGASHRACANHQCQCAQGKGKLLAHGHAPFLQCENYGWA